MHRRTMALALMNMLAIVLTACGSSSGSEGAASDGASSHPSGSSDEIGEAETTDLTVAAGNPELQAYLRYIVAIDEGFFEEEGLTVEVIDTEDNRAALISGDVDIASVATGQVFQAVNEDLGVVALSSENCRDEFSFAVQPDVESVDDLAGTDVLVTGSAGDSSLFPRKRALAEGGWDLDTASPAVTYVNQSGGSEAWQELFTAGRIQLMPFFPDNWVALREYGANPVVSDVQPWPGDFLMARADWVEENPNTVARFLRAVMRAVQFTVAPAVGEAPENKDRLLEIGEAYGFDVTPQAESDDAYAFGTNIWCENLHLDEATWDLMIEVLNEEPADFAAGTALEPLAVAQESLGLDNAAPPDVPWPPAFIEEWRAEIGQ